METVLQLFKFPFEFIYWFLPWSIMILSFFHKGVFTKVIASHYNRFMLFAILINIVVYWTSPEVYARYLLMFVPLFYTLIFTGYNFLPSEAFLKKTIQVVLLVFSFIFSLVFLIVFFHPVKNLVNHAYLKVSLILILLVFLLYKSIRNLQNVHIYLIVILLVSRIGFNWFVLPYRYSEIQNHTDKT
ncbi:MAG: hypothetical protein HC906_09640 [Bacteroidales bacterium]|nr:hypothetical protein [Bacteroidales bacterium]